MSGKALEDMDDVEVAHKVEDLNEEEQQKHIEAMKVEAKKYLELVAEEKGNYYKKENEIGYVLHADWFSKWESMVYLTDFQYQ